MILLKVLFTLPLLTLAYTCVHAFFFLVKESMEEPPGEKIIYWFLLILAGILTIITIQLWRLP